MTTPSPPNEVPSTRVQVTREPTETDKVVGALHSGILSGTMAKKAGRPGSGMCWNEIYSKSMSIHCRFVPNP